MISMFRRMIGTEWRKVGQVVHRPNETIDSEMVVRLCLGGKGLARNALGRRNMDASVRQKARHVGGFRLQEQREWCIWVSQGCLAVETAANVFMIFD